MELMVEEEREWRTPFHRLGYSLGYSSPGAWQPSGELSQACALAVLERRTLATCAGIKPDSVEEKKLWESFGGRVSPQGCPRKVTAGCTQSIRHRCSCQESVVIRQTEGRGA